MQMSIIKDMGMTNSSAAPKEQRLPPTHMHSMMREVTRYVEKSEPKCFLQCAKPVLNASESFAFSLTIAGTMLLKTVSLTACATKNSATESMSAAPVAKSVNEMTLRSTKKNT